MATHEAYLATRPGDVCAHCNSQFDCPTMPYAAPRSGHDPSLCTGCSYQERIDVPLHASHLQEAAREVAWIKTNRSHTPAAANQPATSTSLLTRTIHAAARFLNTRSREQISRQPENPPVRHVLENTRKRLARPHAWKKHNTLFPSPHARTLTHVLKAAAASHALETSTDPQVLQDACLLEVVRTLPVAYKKTLSTTDPSQSTDHEAEPRWLEAVLHAWNDDPATDHTDVVRLLRATLKRLHG